MQALWGSWGLEAWVHDQASGQFAKADQIAPINMGGEFVASRGPLYIPPSEQGQPVVFHAGGSPNAHDMAGRYANGLVGVAFTIEDARNQRAEFRNAAERAGRDPDEIKFFAGVMPTLGVDKRAAMDRRSMLSEHVLPHRLAYLGQMLGLTLGPVQLDQPLTQAQMGAA